MKKIYAWLLVVCMVLALGLTACSNTNATTTTTAAPETTTTKAAATGDDETTGDATGDDEPAGEVTWETASWTKDTSPIDMDVWIDWDWWSRDTWEGATAEEMTRITGVNLTVTKSSDPTQLSVLLAGNELPDLIFCDTNVERYYDQDVCYAWDVLGETACPEFLDLVDDIELPNNTAPDGHIYTFKTHYKNDRCFEDDRWYGNMANYAAAVRMDTLDKMGEKVPTSVEELDTLFYKVKDLIAAGDPAVAGITMIFNPHPNWSDPIAYAMGAQDRIYWDNDAKGIRQTLYYDETVQKAYLDYYKLQSKWYRDGILVQDYLGVRPEDQWARNDSGEVFAFRYNCSAGPDSNGRMRTAETGGFYDDLTRPVFTQLGLITYNGKHNGIYEMTGTGWASFFIAATNPYPERSLCFAEFCKSPDGDWLAYFGVEGVKWEYNSAGLPVNTKAYNEASSEEQLMMSGTWYFQGSDFTEGLSWCAVALEDENPDIKYHKYSIYDAQPRMGRLKEVKKIMANYRNPSLAKAIVPSDNELYANQTKINDEWTKTATNMIMAASDEEVETLFNNFQQFAKDNGIDDLMDVRTEQYKQGIGVYQQYGFYTDVVVD